MRTRTIPKAADVLCGFTQTDGATLITIPANRVWQGWIAINGAIEIGASGTGPQSSPTISVAGSTATPSAGVILGVAIATATQTTSSTGQNSTSERIFITVSAGASSATLTVQKHSATIINATAAGVLIA